MDLQFSTFLQPYGCKHLVTILMYRLYGFYTPEIGDTHIWVLQFVNSIVKGGRGFMKPYKW